MTHYTAHFAQPTSTEKTHLVVLLHGYGSNEQDLLGLTPYLPQEGITYIALRAPQPVGHLPSPEATTAYVDQKAPGYQWWPLTPQLETTGFRPIELSVAYLLDWLQPLSQDYKTITLLGFSQGMAIATSAARRRPDLINAIVGLSGFAVTGGDHYFKDAELAARKIPLFWGRGDADPIITADKISYTEAWAPAHTTLESHIYPGLPHSVSAEELAQVSDFLTRVLPA